MTVDAMPTCAAIGPAEIRQLLPHRYPMLLVDDVIDIVPGERLVARKAVSVNEPWYARTDETAPAADFAYPKTLLLESWCQAAGVLATIKRPNPDVTAGKVMLFGAITDVEFHNDVFPGEVVEHHVAIFRAVSDTVIVTGASNVAGRAVLTVSRVVMAFRDAAMVRPSEMKEEADE